MSPVLMLEFIRPVIRMWKKNHWWFTNSPSPLHGRAWGRCGGSAFYRHRSLRSIMHMSLLCLNSSGIGLGLDQLVLLRPRQSHETNPSSVLALTDHQRTWSIIIHQISHQVHCSESLNAHPPMSQGYLYWVSPEFFYQKTIRSGPAYATLSYVCT